MNKSYYILFFVFAVIVSCNETDKVGDTSLSNSKSTELHNINSSMSLDRFVEFVANKENQLTKNKEISDINFQLAFMPKEYLAYLELKNENYSKEQFAKTASHYEGMSYFNLRLHLLKGQGELLKYNLSSGQQYEARIKYMSFEMQKDVFLVQGNDTLLPGMFHFERIFEVAPYATVMLAFDNAKFNQEEEFTIVYNDKLFNKGFIKYNYKNNQLIDLPNITGV
ncbi:MAG: hypothetical protein JNL69_10090 [Bacteroidia bacterium]|nr:hypothetical protein [Bacteroidia bacterium]